jgi:hypothetical protein
MCHFLAAAVLHVWQSSWWCTEKYLQGLVSSLLLLLLL